MSVSSISAYSQSILRYIPFFHWVVMGTLTMALTVYLLIRKKYSIYGTICLGVTVFIGLFLLDAAVLSRLNSNIHPETGFGLAAEYYRLIRGGEARWSEMLANVAAFIPFGFFLSEFLFTTKRFAPRRQLARIALVTFGLSLCIESLQLLLRLGVFEVTDLVLNTAGGGAGAGVSFSLTRFLISRPFA